MDFYHLLSIKEIIYVEKLVSINWQFLLSAQNPILRILLWKFTIRLIMSEPGYIQESYAIRCAIDFSYPIPITVLWKACSSKYHLFKKKPQNLVLSFQHKLIFESKLFRWKTLTLEVFSFNLNLAFKTHLMATSFLIITLFGRGEHKDFRRCKYL